MPVVSCSLVVEGSLGVAVLSGVVSGPPVAGGDAVGVPPVLVVFITVVDVKAPLVEADVADGVALAVPSAAKHEKLSNVQPATPSQSAWSKSRSQGTPSAST